VEVSFARISLNDFGSEMVDKTISPPYFLDGGVCPKPYEGNKIINRRKTTAADIKGEDGFVK
jgi:hypothetical protein